MNNLLRNHSQAWVLDPCRVPLRFPLFLLSALHRPHARLNSRSFVR